METPTNPNCICRNFKKQESAKYCNRNTAIDSCVIMPYQQMYLFVIFLPLLDSVFRADKCFTCPGFHGFKLPSSIQLSCVDQSQPQPQPDLR